MHYHHDLSSSYQLQHKYHDVNNEIPLGPLRKRLIQGTNEPEVGPRTRPQSATLPSRQSVTNRLDEHTHLTSSWTFRFHGITCRESLSKEWAAMGQACLVSVIGYHSQERVRG